MWWSLTQFRIKNELHSSVLYCRLYTPEIRITCSSEWVKQVGKRKLAMSRHATLSENIKTIFIFICWLIYLIIISKLSFVNNHSLLCGETKHKEGTYFISKYELFLPTNLIQIWKDYRLKAACFSCFMHFPITYNFLHEVWNLFLTNVIAMIYSPGSNLFMLIKQICSIWVKF